MKSVEKECVIEFEERKSKFIGYVKPVEVSKRQKILLHLLERNIKMQLTIVLPIRL